MEAKEVIEEILVANNFSQADLALIMHVSQKAVSNWINGKELPQVRNIIMIYEKFGITPNELLGLEEPKSFKLLTKKGG